MSQWTHVNAAIRIDSLEAITGTCEKPDLGNTCDFHSEPEEWMACNVPRGSEGSLQHMMHTNPQQHAMAKYSILIWGDLRSYSNVDEIIAYLTRITEGRMVRSGVAEIDVEFQKTIYLFFNQETKSWEHITNDQDNTNISTPS